MWASPLSRGKSTKWILRVWGLIYSTSSLNWKLGSYIQLAYSKGKYLKKKISSCFWSCAFFFYVNNLLLITWSLPDLYTYFQGNRWPLIELFHVLAIRLSLIKLKSQKEGKKRRESSTLKGTDLSIVMPVLPKTNKTVFTNLHGPLKPEPSKKEQE